MYNVIIWGTGHEYNNYINCLRLLELKRQISVVGITSNDKDINISIDNYPFPILISMNILS